MMVVITVLVVAVVALIVQSLYLYSKVKQGKPQPLSEEERAICALIVDKNIDHPWICRKAVETGECTCLPCEKLEKAKRHEITVLRRK